MSILIIFKNKDAKPWKKILQQKLPDIDIEIYPKIKDINKIDFALCWKPDKNVLSIFKNLKVAQSVGASADSILNSQKLSENIVVTRIVDKQLSIDMFEYVLTGIMDYLKNIAIYFNDKKSKNWQQKPYKNITNTSVCVLGLGEIGAYVAVKLSALGFKTKGWSKTKKKIENIETFYDTIGLDQALDGIDVLINLLPLTKETENILCLQNFSKLNKNSFLINVGRGQHLVEKDLLICLKNKQFSGALLDVFKEEPLPKTHPFWDIETITITPHIASITNIETASDCVVENYRRLQRNEKLTNIVSVSKGY